MHRPRPRSPDFVSDAIDSWDLPSQMPDHLAWLVAYLTGAWRIPLSDEPPDPAFPTGARPAAAAGFSATEVWGIAARQLIESDRHAAWRCALFGWLTSQYARFDDPAANAANAADTDDAAFSTPGGFRRLRRAPDPWPTFDRIPAFVAFHFAVALCSGLDRSAIRAAAVRLSPDWLPPPAAFVFTADSLDPRLLTWLRDVARVNPILALKIGAEAALRSAAACDQRRTLAA